MSARVLKPSTVDLPAGRTFSQPKAALLAVGASSLFDDERGTTRVERLRPRVMRFTSAGHLSVAQARFALDHMALVLADEPVSFAGFYDWEAMVGYDSEARSLSTSFLIGHRAQLSRIAVLTGSTLVAMGLNVANVVLNGFLSGTGRRDEFEAWQREGLAESG